MIFIEFHGIIYQLEFQAWIVSDIENLLKICWKFVEKFSSNFSFNLPLMTLYVAKIWVIDLAGEVSAKPSEHNRDPAMATLRYENSFSSGPTNNPEKFIITFG